VRDLEAEPLGTDRDGRPVFLRDVWPTPEEVRRASSRALDANAFRARYASVFDGDETWRALEVPKGALFEWDPKSTYIAEPPFLATAGFAPEPLRDLEGLRVLAILGDSITTDHVSPAGSIPPESPAGRYLVDRGVAPKDFNTYGARRGNHEVMVRGTFANVRLRNALAPGTEGGFTTHQPSGDSMTIFEASVRYRAEGASLLVLAGKEYGSGSSRDWAAKGPFLLGVRAVIAESFERIHRSNLIGMGILPLEFLPGESVTALGLTGREAFDVRGLAALRTRQDVEVVARRDSGPAVAFRARARVDSPAELEYFREGGILPAVLRRTLRVGR
jgi:aconitate hydratase